MTHDDMLELARDLARQKPFLRLASTFSPEQIAGYRKIRVGSEYDGGYVMLDDFKDIDLGLSFGVETNADWDLDVVAHGIKVQQYDGTIARAPVEHPLITWHQKMIAAGPHVPNSETIGSILDQAKITRDASVILKMDIEASEWPVFEHSSAEHLKRFSQILVEFHNFSYARDSNWLSCATRVMEKLREHFAVYHVHANNWGPMAVVGNVYFPDTLEVSFANRSRYKSEPSQELFPTALDRPNNPLKPDLYLGAFKYAPAEGRVNG